jgi:hypothetical protein
MKNILQSVAKESGIWNGSRKQSHAFLLSTSVYQITKIQKNELVKLGIALHDCLLGLSHIAVIAYDSILNYNGTWAYIRKVFSTGVPRFFDELQGLNVKDIPRLLKVDLMINQFGEFKIAEIDGHNKHGLGYSTLAMNFRKALLEDVDALPGVVQTLSEEIVRLGYSNLKLFYADQDRFYVPEFEIARNEFSKHGISCQLIFEMDCKKEILEEGLFLDLPFLYHEVDLYNTIIPAYKNSKVKFIIPPKPCLGSKGVLALLRNDTNDERLESILRTFISKNSLELVRRYIPETLLVGKQGEGLTSIKSRVSLKKYVLKEAISSGMKGTCFSDSPEFDSVLACATNSNMNWVLQEEIENQPQTFSWYENDIEKSKGDLLMTSNDWFTRVTVHYVNHQLADIVVTARRDKSVHGAKDSIQIGTIVV